MQLETFIEQSAGIEKQKAVSFAALWETMHTSKNEIIAGANTINSHLFFVEKGVIAFYKMQQKKKRTTWLSFEGEMATDTHGFFRNEKTKHEMRTVTDTVLRFISKEKLEDACKQSHEWEHWVRKMMEDYIVKIIDRMHQLQLMPLRERYMYILQQKPLITSKITLGELASYLNCSQEALSRIRAERF